MQCATKFYSKTSIHNIGKYACTVKVTKLCVKCAAHYVLLNTKMKRVIYIPGRSPNHKVTPCNLPYATLPSACNVTECQNISKHLDVQ